MNKTDMIDWYDGYGDDSWCGFVKHPDFGENIWLSLKRSGGFLKLCFEEEIGNTKFDIVHVTHTWIKYSCFTNSSYWI